MYSASIKIRREGGRKVGTSTGDKSLGFFLPSRNVWGVRSVLCRKGKNISEKFIPCDDRPPLQPL